MSQLKIVLVKKAKEQEVRYRHRLDTRSSASIPVQRTNELAIAQQSSNREIPALGKLMTALIHGVLRQLARANERKILRNTSFLKISVK